jgi:hypothetical protein
MSESRFLRELASGQRSLRSRQRESARLASQFVRMAASQEEENADETVEAEERQQVQEAVARDRARLSEGEKELLYQNGFEDGRKRQRSSDALVMQSLEEVREDVAVSTAKKKEQGENKKGFQRSGTSGNSWRVRT